MIEIRLMAEASLDYEDTLRHPGKPPPMGPFGVITWQWRSDVVQRRACTLWPSVAGALRHYWKLVGL